eukprot:TRINITY_DN30592_c0_g1_i1.p2 TRINITY_DN30592_c0_g1~~TRINITY_DN30592_c0_g1_i1.p2  ORF type:complete len:121 (+),score=11.43 TRINITY_DN30592_c0_g1_i1:42-404(+)
MTEGGICENTDQVCTLEHAAKITYAGSVHPRISMVSKRQNGCGTYPTAWLQDSLQLGPVLAVTTSVVTISRHPAGTSLRSANNVSLKKKVRFSSSMSLSHPGFQGEKFFANAILQTPSRG